jgi:hypothetical protein
MITSSNPTKLTLLLGLDKVQADTCRLRAGAGVARGANAATPHSSMPTTAALIGDCAANQVQRGSVDRISITVLYRSCALKLNSKLNFGVHRISTTVLHRSCSLNLNSNFNLNSKLSRLMERSMQ